ncbi:MAG: glycoside hydrolase family 78 protein [Opitutales bacterium]|nr:glycoside hydrolase family 78 protein [Opitutales bacterium]
MRLPLFYFLSLVYCSLGLSLSAEVEAPVELVVNEGFESPIGFYDSEPRFSWKLKGEPQGLRQQAYEIDVASIAGNNLWSSGRVDSNQSIDVPYGGRPFKSRELVQWRVRFWDQTGTGSEWSDWARIELGLLESSDWSGQWIHPLPKPADEIEENFGQVVYFRKTFNVDAHTKTGRLYVTSKGIFEISINGQKVGHDAFVPGFTDYHKRIETLTYDVTELVRAGKNVITAEVANGWYAGRLMWNKKKHYWGSYPELLVQLELLDEKNQLATVVSDETWHYTKDGPVVMADIYDGEDYDARLELHDFDALHFEEKSLKPVATSPVEAMPLLMPKRFAPSRVTRTLQSVSVSRISEQSVIFDLGQNMVGWPEIHLPVIAGQTIQIRVAEMLQADGSIYTENYRSARSMANYTPAKTGVIQWKPTFSFFGFRYVEVTGFDPKAAPTLDWVCGHVVHTDFKQVGEFTSSHAKLNQLQQNIQWGQIGNFLDIPTDCPQRDERLGWTGDAQVFAATSLFNYDTHAFWASWLQSVRENQQPNGAVSNFVPAPPGHAKGTSPGWGDCAFIIPWELYVRTGDIEVLRENYEMMCKRVQCYANASKDGLVEFKGFGDWLQPILVGKAMRGDTSMQLISTAFYGYGASLCAKAAAVLGKQEDVLKYEALFDEVRTAAAAHFLDDSGKLTTAVETQTGYLLLLGFDLVPSERRSEVAAQLSVRIKADGNRLNTGFLGTPLINRVLDDTGHLEQAIAVLFTNEYPSWFYSIDQGATTMWERWNSYSYADGFGNKSMNSFNHYAYGAVGQWMYERLAGLAPDPKHPGYKHMILRPILNGPLTSASVSIDTRYGRASSAWQKTGDTYALDILIPANTTGTLYLPDYVEILSGVELIETETDGSSRVELHSGPFSLKLRDRSVR